MAPIQQLPPRTKKAARDTAGGNSSSGSGSGSAGTSAAESKKKAVKAKAKPKKKGETSDGASVAIAVAIVGAKGKRKRPLAKAVGKKQQQREDEEEDGEIFEDDDDDEQDDGYEDFEDDDEEETKSSSQHSTGEGESKSNGEGEGEQEEKAKPRRGRRRMLHDEEQRKMRRKNQCKLNQRRYRARQRGMISTLSLETDTLTDYIHELEAYQQFLSKYKQNEADLAAAARRGGSIEDLRPGLVVGQFFHFFSHGFALHSVEISDIQERFVRFISAPNLISQGATKAGVDALLLQLKRYTSYHAVFELHLDSRRVVHSPEHQQQQQSGDGGNDEEDKAASLSAASGSTWVVQVSGRMHLRLSRDTVMLVYPHIVEDEALSYRVVGHEIDPPFSFVFQFNEHGKLCKLELMVDFAGAFMQLLSSAEQVVTLLGRALISPHCELGIDPHEESAIGPESGRENKQLSLKFILL